MFVAVHHGIAIYPCDASSPSAEATGYLHLPDREDTAGLSETRLLLDTTDALLENRRDLSRCGLGIGVGTGLHRGNVDSGGCGISGLGGKNKLAEARTSRIPPRPNAVAKQLKKAFPAVVGVIKRPNWDSDKLFR